jgi:hydroxymethylpyrimidine/phosphomethylpyrimidine kinase
MACLILFWQIRCVLDDVETHAIKTGMLCNAEISAEVAKVLAEYKAKGRLPPLVCDPVCVSTSGHTLLEEDALGVFFDQLFALATVITPNKSETELLLKTSGSPTEISTLEDMIQAAKKLSSFSSTSVLVKGGHLTSSLQDVEDLVAKNPELKVIKQNILDENMEILLVASGSEMTSRELVVDILFEREGRTTVFARPRIHSTSTHGTGCTLASAIACGLAQGIPRAFEFYVLLLS